MGTVKERRRQTRPIADEESYCRTRGRVMARKGISGSLARRRQQRAVDRQLTEARTVLPIVMALQEIPGIGPVTATAVAVCLTSKQFDHPDLFVASSGLDTRVRDSGQHTGRRAGEHPQS